MFQQMIIFEWRYHTRQASFYVSILVFFFAAFFTATNNDISMGGGNILKNGPFSIMNVMLVMGMFAMFFVVNFVANTALRNSTSGMEELVCCKPIKPFGYQLGRFLGAHFIVCTVFLSVPLGLLLGTLMPWVDSSRFGPVDLSYYINGLAYYIWPNLFLMSCFFYAVAIKFRSIMVVYLSAIGVLLLNELSVDLMSSPEARYLAAILDPFALSAFFEITRYWSISEKNNAAIEWTTLLLQNRILWVSFAVVILLFFTGLKRLDFIPKKTSKWRSRFFKRSVKNSALSGPIAKNSEKLTENMNQLNVVSYKTSFIGIFIARLKLEVSTIIFSPTFILLNIITMSVLIIVTTLPEGMFGTTFYPLTQSMVAMIRTTLFMLMMIVITYYSAEVIWREKKLSMVGIIYSMPVPNWVFWLAKLIAMWCMIIIITIISILMTIIVQISQSYSNIELSQYFISLFFFSVLPWMMYSVLAFFLQVISSNKYIGMFLFVIFIASRFIMNPIGLEHNMLQFGQSPELQYSDINGYGWTLLTQSWYMLYWGSFSVLLALMSYGLWLRGEQIKLINRLRLFTYQIGRSGRVISFTALLVFIVSALYIAYNTRYVNTFETSHDRNAALAEYEHSYKQFIDLPAPTITDMNISIDIFPKKRSIKAHARFEVQNKSQQAISRFLVTMPTNALYQFTLSGGELLSKKGAFNTHWFEFSEPLAIGEKRKGEVIITKTKKGFVDNNVDVTLVKNGTFINSVDLLPIFGYQVMAELKDINDRKIFDLGPAQRANKREDDDYYHHQSILGHMSGLMKFEATLSTSLEQMAIAPGYLQKQWQEGDRNYFHYKMDAPIENYFSIMSAELSVKKETYDGINYEVYYHPDHHYNVPIMMQSMKDSVAYFSEIFGPYQHKQARIIEFPGYEVFAQSFPNTIAYSEKIGFINDTRDSKQINSVYYVTAHEMAHQWWGGQVNGANVQGSTMLTETMAQYSALMLTRKTYGMEKVRGILRYELDRYLAERSRELIEEQPLAKVENQQYIHYRKGSVVMMALLNQLGEEHMNQAFSKFIKKYRFRDDIYPITTDLIEMLAEKATTEQKAFINRAFEEIYLYDLQAHEAEVKVLANGHYELTFAMSAKQLLVDGQGVESEVELSELIEIGIFTNDPYDFLNNEKPQYLQKHKIVNGKNQLTIITKSKPQYVVIDPYLNYIDRKTDDNFIKL